MNESDRLIALLEGGDPVALQDNAEELLDELRRLTNSNSRFAFNLDQCSTRMFIFEDAVNKILRIADDAVSVSLHENVMRAMTQIQHIARHAQTTARGER